MVQPRREWYLSRKLKVSVKWACHLDYPVGLDIVLIFTLCYSFYGVVKVGFCEPELMQCFVTAFSLVAYAISAHCHIHI